MINILRLLFVVTCALSVTSCTRPRAGQPAAHSGSPGYPPRFQVSEQVRHGGAVARRYGFIDVAGKIVIPIRFEQADYFSEGLAHVWVGDRQGYIDTAGKVRFYLPDDCMSASRFSEGLALVNLSGEVDYDAMRGGRWGYVDRDGRFAVPAQFEVPLASSEWTGNTGEFSEGLAAMPGPDGRFGFIDRTGRWVIPPQFDRVERKFLHGLAQVEVNIDASGNSTWGYIDRTGRFVWKSKLGPP
jgi:hypothetical protein